MDEATLVNTIECHKKTVYLINKQDKLSCEQLYKIQDLTLSLQVWLIYDLSMGQPTHVALLILQVDFQTTLLL